ncbi:DUF167 domain-containing protein [Mesorhizobium sp. B292B1B]|uniref:DUF167 domain-containing protein n=1 Tax=unclassified Mesorhizobium TaxID=325217 RepID=UPI001129399E|nr:MULTISPECIES: DUF167 domain-containing protein [unclassified Mesorhizobium]MCA0011736.1 DUF167 domain-containing protein [Mesorhizobium sp. B294B1A1]MCA0036692.1 DUF167 domain-containing protein [Mesorhizobium sp. B292B1B]TPM46686.1 DUF167 domain-containing protein [Mesorhizobium sp. B2-3-2]
MNAPFRIRENGIELFVRLTPKSSIDRFEGIETSADGRNHVKARVRAVPENGAANQALEKLAAKTLGVPTSAVSVVAGATARLKTLRVTGEPEVLMQRIEALSASA